MKNKKNETVYNTVLFIFCDFESNNQKYAEDIN